MHVIFYTTIATGETVRTNFKFDTECEALAALGDRFPWKASQGRAWVAKVPA